MHTAWTRINAIFTFSLCVLATSTFLCFVSTSYYDYTAHVLTPVKLDTDRVSVSLLSDFTGDGEPSDLGFLTLNIHADLNPLFNWNVKQLFVYVHAEYETDHNKLNQVVLWDKIIERDPHDYSKAVINIQNEKPKYYFWDDGVGGLRGHQNISLTMHWNIIPNSGPIFTSGLDIDSHGLKNSLNQHFIGFPIAYTTKRKI